MKARKMDASTLKYVLFVYFVANFEMLLAAPGTIYQEYMEHCAPIFTPEVSQHRCNSQLKVINTMMTNCKKDIYEAPWTCKDSMCMLNSERLLGGPGLPDDVLNESVVDKKIKFIIKTVPTARPVMDTIRFVCLDGKYKQYLPEEFCPLLKYQICVSAVWFQGFLNVTEDWQQNEECAKVLEGGLKCGAAIEILAKDNTVEV